ncbi:MAG: methyltransferase [Candidatus Omnitrophica bacterium]|nr:methyltransferase [Candidatus Omnitrophota bacterium]
MPMFQAGLRNAWLLYIPFLIGGMYIGIQNKVIAKRMADMTGYTMREKVFTFIASLTPYPYMILAVWAPFTAIKHLLYLGAVIYVIGMTMFFLTLYVIAKTPLNSSFSAGVYKISRNPLYVSATLIFLGVSLMTANIILFVFLLAIIVPQHFMILAEERVCRLKYGRTFEEYIKKVPRYIHFSVFFKTIIKGLRVILASAMLGLAAALGYNVKKEKNNSKHRMEDEK